MEFTVPVSPVSPPALSDYNVLPVLGLSHSGEPQQTGVEISSRVYIVTEHLSGAFFPQTRESDSDTKSRTVSLRISSGNSMTVYIISEITEKSKTLSFKKNKIGLWAGLFILFSVRLPWELIFLLV